MTRKISVILHEDVVAKLAEILEDRRVGNRRLTLSRMLTELIEEACDPLPRPAREVVIPLDAVQVPNHVWAPSPPPPKPPREDPNMPNALLSDSPLDDSVMEQEELRLRKELGGKCFVFSYKSGGNPSFKDGLPSILRRFGRLLRDQPELVTPFLSSLMAQGFPPLLLKAVHRRWQRGEDEPEGED